MFFLMQIIFIVLPSNMAAVQNIYTHQIIDSIGGWLIEQGI